MTKARIHRPVAIACILLCPGMTPWSGSQTDADAAQQRLVMERYESMLLSRPREGPVLDRVYRMHIEAMDLQAWLDELAARCEERPDDAAAALLFGLVSLQHGDDGSAVSAFEAAAAADPTDAYAPYLLGKHAYETRDDPAAIKHLNVAAGRARERESLVEIYTALGKAYMRSEDPDRAIEVWDRIVEMSDGDAKAIEELAERLIEERQYDAAHRYYSLLREMPAQSAYQRILYTTQLAALEAQRGEFDRALGLYQEALQGIGPDSWLYPEIHARVESLFLDRTDRTGLVEYYRTRVDHNPRDVDLRLRLARAIRAAGDAAEAGRALDAALELAPSREDLRIQLAELLLETDMFADAVNHLERLVRDDPRNSDHRVRLARAWIQWGESAEHREAARRTLLGISDLDPGDPSLAVRAAESLAGSGFDVDAVAMYERAVALSPGAPEYREYLGAHLADIGRRPEALDAFRGLAEGPDPSARELARLAEVLTFHGFESEAMDAARRARDAAPDDFEIGRAHLHRLVQRGEIEEALTEMDRLRPLAPNPYFADELLNRQIHLLSRAGRLEEAYNALLARMEDESHPTVDDLLAAARMALALGDRDGSRQWADAAVARPGADVRTLRVAERVAQWTGDIQGQLSLLEKMAHAEPAQAPEFWKRMAGILHQLGDLDGALGIAAEWIAGGRSVPEAYLLQADLQIEAGDLDAAFLSLNRAIHLDPDSSMIRVQLADLYRSQFMVPEAIQVYWDALAAAEQIGGRLAIMKPLVDLHAAQGRFEALEARLRAMKRDAEDPMEPSLLLVAAYQQIDDMEAARRELTDLASRRPNDPNVLRQLVLACRREGDDDQAIAYQRRLVEIEPSSLSYRQLGDLHLEAGFREEALAAWRMGIDRRASSDRDAVARASAWIEQLYDNRFYEEAFEALDSFLRDHADNWSVVLKVAIAYARNDKVDEAVALFRRVLEWPEVVSPHPDPERRSSGGAASADLLLRSRYPEEYLELQRLMWARERATTPSPGMPQPWQGTAGTITLDEAKALATAYLSTLEGQSDELDRWWVALQNGSEEDRRLALKMSIVLRDTEMTRSLAEEWVREDPRDVFARFVLALPSVSETRWGMSEDSMERAEGNLQWLRENEPEYAWFYDWYSFRLLVQTGADAEEIRSGAEGVVLHAKRDPFVLVQCMPLFQQAGLYDLYEDHLDAAVTYYEEQGAKGPAGHLLDALGGLALRAFQEGNPDGSLRLLSAYLDASHPPVRSLRIHGQGLSRATLGAGRPTLEQEFPQPCYWWTPTRRDVLLQIHHAFVEAGEEESLTTLLEDRARRAGGLDAVAPLLGVAYARWWSGDVDGTHRALVDAARAGDNHDELRLILARFYAQIGRSGDALNMLSRMRTQFGPVHMEARFWMLRLALDAGSLEEASAAADELSNMHLTPDEMLNLSDALAVLGRFGDARIQERRAQRMARIAGLAAGPSPSRSALSQLDHMRLLEQNGDREQAARMAVRTLRQARNFQAPQSETIRRESIALLRRIERLDSYIERLETDVASPHAPEHAIEDLYFCYRVVGLDEKAASLLDAHVFPTVGQPDLRVRLAEALVQLQDYPVAVSLLNGVLEEDPGFFFGPEARYRLLIQAYVRGDAMNELVARFRSLEPAQWIGPGRGFRGGRDQRIANLLGFAQECINNPAVDAEVVLEACRLLEHARSPRYVRSRYAVQSTVLKARALRRLDRPEEAFEALVSCVAGEPVCRILGLDGSFIGEPEPLYNLVWRPDRADALVLETIQSAESVGRLDELTRACRSAVEEGYEEAWFLLCLGLAAQGNAGEAVRLLSEENRLPVPRSNRQDREWARTTVRVLLGQVCMDAGEYEHAMAIFEEAIRYAGQSDSSGMGDQWIGYMIQACRQAGKIEDARDVLLSWRNASLPPVPAPHLTTIRFERLRTIMERLAGLGFYEDALDIAHEVQAMRASPSQEHYHRSANQFVSTIRNESFPELKGSTRMTELISRLETQIEEDPDDISKWEHLLWLYESNQETNKLNTLRSRMLSLRPESPQWRIALARSCLKSGLDAEACDHFLSALRLQPELAFRERNEYQKMLWAFLRADRVDELRDAVLVVDWREFMSRPRVEPSQRAREVANLVDFAAYCLQPSVRRPALALDLAKMLRRVTNSRPQFRSYSDRLAEVIVQAVGELDAEPSARLAEYLEFIAGPALRTRLSVPEELDAVPVPWTLNAAWRDDGVDGLLTWVLDLAEEGSRLEELADASALAARDGDPENHYLQQLFEIRAGTGPVSSNALDGAIASVFDHTGLAADRAYLLSLLGLELSRSRRDREAVRLHRQALNLAEESGRLEPIQSSMLFLADALHRLGQTNEVVEVLRRSPAILSLVSSGAQVLDTRSSVMLRMARKLWDMGYVLEAWDHAHGVLAFYADEPRNRRRREAQVLIEEILTRDFASLERSGELERLEVQVQTLVQDHPDSIEALEKLYRLRRAAGRDSEARDALRRMEKAIPRDPAVRFMLAEAYLRINDPEAAALQYDALLDLAPGFLFTDGAAYRDLLTAYDSVGRLADLARQLRRAGVDALIARDGSSGDQDDAVIRNLIQLARAAAASPVGQPGIALEVLALLEDPSPRIHISVALDRQIRMAAIEAYRALDQDVDVYREYARWIAPPRIRDALGLQTARNAPPDLTSSMMWRGDRLAGDVTRFLDAAESADRLDELTEACRAAQEEPPEPHSAVLLALCEYRREATEARSAALARARAALRSLESSDEKRVQLASLLACACLDAGDFASAEAVARDALHDASQQILLEDEQALVLLTAEALYASGARQEAWTLLAEYAFPAQGFDRTDLSAFAARQRFIVSAAKQLGAWERPIEALARIREGLDLAADQQNDAALMKLRNVQEEIREKVLPAMAESNRIGPVIDELKRAIDVSTPANDALEELYWCYSATGDREQLRTVEQELLKRNPEDAALLHRLARGSR